MDKFGDTYKIHYKTLRNEEKYEMLDGRDRNIHWNHVTQSVN